MKPLYKGLLIALLHVLIVSALGAKFVYDRSTRPRVWVETMPYDPELPIRGRYVSMQVIVDAPGFTRPATRGDLNNWWSWRPGWRSHNAARLEVQGDKLVAVPDPNGELSVRFLAAPGVVMPPLPPGTDWEKEQKLPIDFPLVAVLTEPVLFFIPEHADDPSIRRDGSRLWVEVTIPRKGPPRPIRLGAMKDGKLTPLEPR